MASATKKQVEIINDMRDVLDNEFDFGSIETKSNYSIKEASELIKMNKDIYFGIMDEGQCTVRQYNELTRIAGRAPRLPRYLIGYSTAIQWIREYSSKVA